MKTYKIVYERWHESFSGHDHCDGEEILLVKAINYSSARKKAEKEIAKRTRGFIQSCWGKISGINEIFS